MAATANNNNNNVIRQSTAYGSICSSTTTTTSTATTTAAAVSLKFKNTSGEASAVCIPIETSEWTPLLTATDDGCAQHGSSEAVRRLSSTQLNCNDCLQKQTTSAAATAPANGSIGNEELPRCFNFSTIAFLALLSTGLTLGSYLLWRESQIQDIGYELNLVQRDIWSELPLPLGGLLNHSFVHNVAVTQTGGEACLLPATCLNLLRQMQRNNKEPSELNYNFLVGGDGQTYEARGWDHESGYAELPQATTLVIGLLGNYTKNSPGMLQLKSTVSLIWESLKRKKLRSGYRLFALRNATDSAVAGERLFKELMHWPQFMGILETV